MTTLCVSCRHCFDSGFQIDVDFAAPRGVTALFGPTGSGKTTILNIVAGLLRPHEGRVEIGEQVLLDRSGGIDLPPEHRGVGYVPQDDLLFPHLSVEHNLRFGIRRSRADGPSFEHVVAMLRLTEFLDRRPSTLSGGQRQRVALGRAVLRAPHVLLMDEPVNAQDEGLKHRLIDDLCGLVADLDIVAIFVSHDQGDVRRFAERVVLLEAGRAIGAGPAAATLDAAGAAGRLTPTNLIRVTSVCFENRAWLGKLGDNLVHLPTMPESYGDTAYLAFSPADVLLSREDIAGVSVRNHWRGRVIDVVNAAGRILVHLDVGQPIWAEITPGAQRDLGLRSGDDVFCLVKTSVLRHLQSAEGAT